MTKTLGFTLSTGLLLLSQVVLAAPEPSEKKTNPLDGQPAIRNRYELRKGRFEIGPSFQFSMNRAMRHAILFGAKAEYHILDYLSIGVDGGGGIGVNTGLAGEIKDQYAAEGDRWTKISNGFADIKFAADVRLAFTPMNGKLAIFGKAFVYYDFYAFIGLAMALTKNKAQGVDSHLYSGTDGLYCYQTKMTSSTDAAERCDVDSATNGFRAGPAFGFGMHVFFTEFFSFGVEAKDLIFFDNETGGDVTRGVSGKGTEVNNTTDPTKSWLVQINGDDKTFAQHWFFGFNFTFYFPINTVISP
jgi:hypothetical protein